MKTKVFLNILFTLILSLFLFTHQACKKQEEVNDTPPGLSTTFTDPRDGQTYKIVTIGDQSGEKSSDQVWFAENINFFTADYSSWYDSSSVKGAVYGRLYTWSKARSICPKGWHLPSDEEWKTLEMNLGMSQSEADKEGKRGTNQGKNLKSTSGWNSNNSGFNGTDRVGFKALPAGYGGQNGEFDFLGMVGYWWSTTVYSEDQAWIRSISSSNDRVSRKFGIKGHKYSVRCVKN